MKRDKVLQKFIYEKGQGTPGMYSMNRDNVLQEFIYEKGRDAPEIYL